MHLPTLAIVNIALFPLLTLPTAPVGDSSITQFYYSTTTTQINMEEPTPGPFMCPITMDVMEDPVMATDSQTCESPPPHARSNLSSSD